MENLKAYLSNIEPQLLNQLSGKPRAFIRLFKAYNFLTEEAFAQAFCGDKHNKNYYYDWKSRTLKILQALAIVSNTKGGSFIKKKLDLCQKKFLLGHKLLTQAERGEGLRLIKQAFQLASEYDFVYMACELASIIHHDYVYYHPNKKMTLFYAGKVEKYLNDYTAEKKAEHYYFALVEKMSSSVSPDELQQTIENISRYKGESIKYKVYLAIVQVYHALYTGRYKQLVDNSDDVLRFFQNKKGAFPAHYLFFLRNKGTAQTALGRYEAAANSYQEAEQYTKNVPYNIYLLQFYKTLNALHAGQYQLAYNLYQKNKRCKIEPIREQFAIIEAYLCFLIHTGYLQINKTFRIGKYLNETFKAQQDKKGDNVNILIAELLVYLSRNWGKFIDRIEAVQHYSYRHLKGEDTKRAKWFLKILCLMAHPKVNFHPVALQRKAGNYIELLKSHPVRMGENFAIEIIPFDHLLDMILERVMRKVA